RHGLQLASDALRARVDVHRWLREVLGPVGRDDHGRERTVGLEAVVVQTQGLGDPAGIHVVVARELLAVHRGVRVVVGVLPEGDRYVREVVARRAVLVHVPTRQHGDLVDRPEQAERPAEHPLIVHVLRLLRPRTTGAGGALAGAPGEDDVGLAGRDGHRGVGDRAAAGTTAVAD